MKHILGWRQKSLFYQILFSFSMLFVVFGISCVVLYCISFQNLESEIQAKSYILLQKTQQEIDDRINAAQTILEKIYVDTSFQKSVEKDSKETFGMMDTYSIRKKLAEWQTKELSDLFIWYQSSERIVSGTYTSTDPQHYFDVYYEIPNFVGESNTCEAWKQELEDRSGAVLMKQINGGSNTVFLAMKYPTGYTRAGGKAIITAVLQPADIGEALGGLTDGSLYIYNEKGNLLAFTGDWIDGFSLDLNKQSHSYTEKIGTKDYIIQKSQSQKTGNQYVHVIPEQVFWNRQRSYVKTAVFFMIVFGLIGIFLIIWLSKANYRPWEKLVNSVKRVDESEIKEKKIPENEYLQDAFRRTLSQREDIYRQMQSQKVNEAKNQLLKFFRSEITGEEFFSLVYQEELLPKGSVYLLVQFCIENWDQKQIQDLNSKQVSEKLQKKLDDLIKNMVGVGVKGAMTTRLGRRNYLSLIVLQDIVEVELLTSAITQLQVVLKKTAGVGSTVLFSNLETNQMQIPRLFQQVTICEQYRNILGREILISYVSVEKRKFGYRRDQEFIKGILQGWIRQKGQERSGADVIRLVTESALDENTADVDSFLLLKKDLKSVILLLAQESGFSKEMQNKMGEELDTNSSWLEYKICCAKQLTQLKDCVMQGGQEKDLVAQVYEYIHENYACDELNVNYLSDVFHVSAQYLSRCFRTRYQKGIIDEIAQVRVEMAKKALKEGKESIETIALQNGFLSSASFIRTFKKYEGITPGEFRNQNREK